MALRTSRADIESEIDIPEDAVLTSVLERANARTDRIATCATNKGVTLTDVELRGIETLLACHSLHKKHPQYANKSTQDASATFQGQYGMKLEGSKWGQELLEMAEGLGILGCVKGGTVGAYWLGYTRTQREAAGLPEE